MDMSRRNSKCTSIDSFLAGLTKGIIMDINRNKRKGGRDDCAEFSQQSILSAMDRFVQAVNNMDDTVMVPSRLLDMSLQNETTKDTSVVPRSVLNSTDLHGFYNMLNAVKNELIWGPSDGLHLEPVISKEVHQTPKPSPVRRNSTVSMQSYSDRSDSDVESESSAEFDSGVDFDEQSTQIATSFREHLSGLFHTLHQLTDAANYLTTRYQDEVGGCS